MKSNEEDSEVCSSCFTSPALNRFSLQSLSNRRRLANRKLRSVQGEDRKTFQTLSEIHDTSAQR